MNTTTAASVFPSTMGFTHPTSVDVEATTSTWFVTHELRDTYLSIAAGTTFDDLAAWREHAKSNVLTLVSHARAAAGMPEVGEVPPILAANAGIYRGINEPAPVTNEDVYRNPRAFLPADVTDLVEYSAHLVTLDAAALDARGRAHAAAWLANLTRPCPVCGTVVTGSLCGPCADVVEYARTLDNASTKVDGRRTRLDLARAYLAAGDR